MRLPKNKNRMVGMPAHWRLFARILPINKNLRRKSFYISDANRMRGCEECDMEAGKSRKSLENSKPVKEADVERTPWYLRALLENRWAYAWAATSRFPC